MNLQELRKLNAQELQKKELELREEMFKLKFQHTIRRLENPSRLGVLRRDIARVKTILQQNCLVF